MRARMPSPRATTGPSDVARAPGRLDYVDAIKVIMVAVVIVAHVGITYGTQGGWFYTEPTSIVPFKDFMSLVMAVGSLFAMGAFFFLAGMFVPGSLARKGRRRYIVDRVIRLGAPFAAFVVVVIPLVEWAVAADTGGPGPAEIFRGQLARPGSGPLWFAAVLLLFSVAAALLLPIRTTEVEAGPMTPRPLVACAATVAVAEFLLRLAFPIESNQILTVHVWEWGQCGALFGLGIIAARRGWLRQPIPERIRRGCALTASAGAGLLVLLLTLGRDDLGPFRGGLTWQSGAVSLIEGAVAVTATVWLVAAVRGVRSGPGLHAAGRAAFGAYLVQTPIVVGIALLLRPIPVDPAVKLVILLPAGLLMSFGAAWWLTRVPVLRGFL